MANVLLTISDITKEALAVFHEECQLIKSCTRKYEDRFNRTGAAVGSSVDIRKPVRYNVTDGANITGAVQSSEESVVTLSVNKRKVVGMDFSSEDLTLHIDDFSARFIRPAAARLAREVDLEIAKEILINGQRVARATITNDVSFADCTATNAILAQQFADPDRRIYLDADNNASVVNANSGLFQSAELISEQYEKGVMQTSAGLKFVNSESIPLITFSGTITAADVVLLAVSGATSIALDGITGTATEIKKGQAFTIAGVSMIDPETLEAKPKAYTFIASADATITTGAATVLVANPIVANGAGINLSTVNVSALPATNAVVTFLEGAATAGDSAYVIQALAKDSVAFASVDLDLPGVSKMEGRENYDGVSMRILKVYDGQTDIGIYRLDLLFGVKVLRPEFVTSMIGKVV
tara:strand:+ start:5469 stop:6704 length:1236 start_codon:yes stop_codon:yes gene_type:complete